MTLIERRADLARRARWAARVESLLRAGRTPVFRSGPGVVGFVVYRRDFYAVKPITTNGGTT